MNAVSGSGGGVTGRRWNQRQDWLIPGRRQSQSGVVGGGVARVSPSLQGPTSSSCSQIRASRLEQIDKELLEAQDRVQQTEPQVPGGSESCPRVVMALQGGDPQPCPGHRNGSWGSRWPQQRRHFVECTQTEPPGLCSS
jgi:hypothetical protein